MSITRLDILLSRSWIARWLIVLVTMAIPSALHGEDANELTAEERAYLESTGSILFISQESYPPFEFLDESGQSAGMCIDLVRWIADEYEFRAEFRHASFRAAQDAVLNGEADALTSMFYSADRDRLYAFTRKMFDVPATIFVQAERPDIREVEDLAGKRIAMQRGDYAEEFLTNAGIEYTPVYTTDFYSAIQRVVEGNADALVGDEQIVLYEIFSHGNVDQLKRVGDPLYVGRNCMVTREENEVLRNIIDKGIARAQANGVLKRIEEDWLGVRLSLQERYIYPYLVWVLAGAGAVLALILVMWYFNAKLRGMVAARTADLDRSRQRFQAIYDYVNDAIMIHDPDTADILDMNQRACELLGCNREDDLPLDIGVVACGQEGSTRADAVSKVHLVRDKGPQLFQWLVNRKGMEPIWGEVNIRMAQIGGEARAIAVVRDVEERKEAERDRERHNRDLEDKIRRLELIREFHESVSLSLDMERFLDQFGELNDERFAALGADSLHLMLYDESVQGLVGPKHIKDLLRGIPTARDPQRPGYSVSGKCFQSGEPIIVDDCSRSDMIPAMYRHEHNLKSVLAVPIRVKGQVTGVLRIDSTRKQHRFTTQDVEFFSILADQVGIVFESTRLIADIEKARDELRYRDGILIAVSKAAEMLIRSTDFDATVREVLRLLGEATQVSRVYIFQNEWDPQHGMAATELFEWLAEGVTPNITRSELQRYPYRDGFQRWENLLSKGDVIAGAVESMPEPEREFLMTLDVTSIAILPIFTGDDWWGFIGFDHSQQKHQWFSAEIEALRSGASVIGSAIQKRRYDEAIVRAKEEWERTFNSVPELIMILDSDMRVLRINEEMARRTGLSREEAVGLQCRDVLGCNILECQDCPVHETLEGGSSRMEVKLEKLGGNFIVTVTPYLDREGNPAGSVHVLHDITERILAEEERRRLESQVQQTQKLESLGVLAGGIAHDFNNLLTSMLGNADLALMTLPEDVPVRKNIREVAGAAQRAADLCRQLLAYSGKGQFVIDYIDLNDVVQEMAGLLRISVSKKTTLVSDLGSGLPAVQGDITQLRQVVMNLITNASEALRDQDGTVTIHTGVRNLRPGELTRVWPSDSEYNGEYAYIQVSDTGCGMDSETLDRIFDPFFTTKFTGRGLGLAAVLGIIRSHKGIIDIVTRPDKGTIFTVYLPPHRMTAMPTAPAVEPESRDWQGNGTVLLVDDEQVLRSVGSNMLIKMGFEVLLANDGLEGLDRFREHSDHIVAVVLDLNMPRMGGEEAFQEMRQIRTDIPILLSSGYNEQHLRGDLLRNEFAAFIQKPYTFSDLRTKLQDLLNS